MTYQNNAAPAKNFIKTETLGAIVLLASTILGMILINSEYSDYYEKFVNSSIGVIFDNFQFTRPLTFCVNEGLLTIFFFMLGLEIKREFVNGELTGTKRIILPCFSAIGGMVVPAAIYILCNVHEPDNLRGWAIPVAMDTAFTLGILSLFGKRLPSSLRVFLMSLAVIEDVFVVMIIAIFYGHDISLWYLALSFITFGCLVTINHLKHKGFNLYLFFGVLLWIFVLKAGLHASIAGVVFAFTIPYGNTKDNNCMLLNIENSIHKYVSFLILPFFAFINAGVPLSNFHIENLMNPVSIGVILGLLVGKQIGTFGMIFFLIKSKIAVRPRGSSWMQMYGVSVLCGLGFTMSIFISALSFEYRSMDFINVVKASIFVGSIASAILGSIILYFARIKTQDYTIATP